MGILGKLKNVFSHNKNKSDNVNSNNNIGNKKNKQKASRNSNTNNVNFENRDSVKDTLSEFTSKYVDKKTKLDVMAREQFQNCPECEKNRQQKIDELVKKYNDTANKYDINKQMMNVRNIVIQNPSLVLQNIKEQIGAVEKGFNYPLCDKHKDVARRFNNEMIEINNIREAIDLLKQK